MNFQDKIKFFNKNIGNELQLKPANTINYNKKVVSPDKRPKVFLRRATAIVEKNNDDWVHIKSNSFDDTHNDKDVDPMLSSILVDNDLEHFDELKFVNRKYNKDNINNAKKFFKMRFIKKKLENSKKNSNIKTKKSKLDKENNSLLYSKDFLLILEKSIFSFNQKNFQESYTTLKTSEIINSVKEFGEFLLTVSGFDKTLIGEFLAKEKPPNEKGEVLQSFISNIYMFHKKISLLECIRFLLSRINLPKDANLILIIMESFTNTFYKINQDNEDFINIFGNNPDNIYLLVSTLLALNTMFTRTDIKNMNSIKKEEFIKMNQEIDKIYLGNLYSELKKNPITLSDDYNEAIYQKLTPLIQEKNNKNENDNKNTKNIGINNNSGNNKKTNNNIQENVKIENFDILTKEDKELLTKVNKFYKIKSTSTPVMIGIFVNEDFTKLCWSKNMQNIKPDKFLLIKDINDIYNGVDITEHSASIKKYVKGNQNEEKYLNYFISILYNNSKESLDLKSDNLENTILWFKALKSLVNEANNDLMKQKISESDEILKERENTLNEIWDKYIIPKWDKYGNYLLLKKLERVNYFNYLFYDQKAISKNELLEDKKFYTIKYINSFLENIKENKKDLDLNEFNFLCNLGFPFSLRKKIYKIIIGNPCYITNELFSSIKEKLTDANLNFEELEKKYKLSRNKPNNKNNTYTTKANLNELINDIFDIYNTLFVDSIQQYNFCKDQYKFMHSVFIIARIFFSIRKDIIYNKALTEFIFLFLLIHDNEEETFIQIINFFSKNNYIYLFLANEQYRKSITINSTSFFTNLIKNKMPNIEGHLNKLEIIPELYFIDWMKHFFIGTLNISIIMFIFDLFLLNGEYILFQTGLSVLKILEPDLMNMTISQVLKLLKKLPNKYSKETFLDVFNNYNSTKYEYIKWKNNMTINTQKNIFNEQK